MSAAGTTDFFGVTTHDDFVVTEFCHTIVASHEKPAFAVLPDVRNVNVTRRWTICLIACSTRAGRLHNDVIAWERKIFDNLFAVFETKHAADKFGLLVTRHVYDVPTAATMAHTYLA